MYIVFIVGFFCLQVSKKNDEIQLSIGVCKIIVTVAFGAIKYTDVPRSWVTSLLNKYKNHVPDAITKDNAAMKLAPELLERKIVEVNSTSNDLRRISR